MGGEEGGNIQEDAPRHVFSKVGGQYFSGELDQGSASVKTIKGGLADERKCGKGGALMLKTGAKGVWDDQQHFCYREEVDGIGIWNGVEKSSCVPGELGC